MIVELARFAVLIGTVMHARTLPKGLGVAVIREACRRYDHVCTVDDAAIGVFD